MVITTKGSPLRAPKHCLPCQCAEHDRWFLLRTRWEACLRPDHTFRSPFGVRLPRLLPNFTMVGEWTYDILVLLITLTPLWLFASKYLNRPTLKRSVVVFVLGDVGRSPRMMYHAESFANNGFQTYIVGYRGAPYEAPFESQDIDKATHRFKADTRFVVNTTRPVFLPGSAPSVLFASSFYNRRPPKDNTPSLINFNHSSVLNPQHI